MRLRILPGKQFLEAGKWRLEGETVEISDEYKAKVLIASDVAEVSTGVSSDVAEPLSKPETPATKDK